MIFLIRLWLAGNINDILQSDDDNFWPMGFLYVSDWSIMLTTIDQSDVTWVTIDCLLLTGCFFNTTSPNWSRLPDQHPLHLLPFVRLLVRLTGTSTLAFFSEQPWLRLMKLWLYSTKLLLHFIKLSSLLLHAPSQLTLHFETSSLPFANCSPASPAASKDSRSTVFDSASTDAADILDIDSDSSDIYSPCKI